MTSLEIAQLTGKQHKDMLKAIRNMESGWAQVTGRKFALSEYRDPTGRSLTCYLLTKTECLFIATKFNDEARARCQWQLTKNYQHQGLTENRCFYYHGRNGRRKLASRLVWTEKGRQFVLDLIK